MSKIKVSDELVELAREEARVMGRSIGAQVESWARLGRKVEASGALGAVGVRKLLGGRGSVQGLSEADDALYMSMLGAKLEALDGSDTRLLDQLREGGHPVAAEDDRGSVVVDESSGTCPV